MSVVPRLRSYVGGKWHSNESSFFQSLNPSIPSDVVAEVPQGTAEDAKAAVDAAANAQSGWAHLAGPARAEFLYKWANAIADRSEELAQEMAREVGKPITEARGEVARCFAILRYYAGECVREVGDVIPPQTAGSLQYTVRQPLGVVGLITPWNFPLAIPLWKAAPALAMGNTVVLKSAEASSHMSSLLAQTAEAANLPHGVFNVLLGTGQSVGSALLEQEAVQGLSFTGSVKVGMALAERAAARNIKYQCEMGGKNVAIVLPDANMDQAAQLIAGGAMRYAGQKCTATSRAVVASGAMDSLLPKLKEQVESLKLGPVTDAQCGVGPLISETSHQKVNAAISAAGFSRLTGAHSPEGDGYFVQPTVFTDVDPDSDLATEELFGPVLAVIRAESAEEALELSNRTRYGLSASLFTSDIRSALTYIDRIKAGMVRVNGDTTGVDPHAPFGGLRASSSHSREQGPAAKDFYSEIKTVQINP